MRGSRPGGVLLLGGVIVLGSWIGPGVWAVRQRRQHAAAQAGAEALARAGANFYADYGAWPTARTCPPGDCRFGGRLPNAEVLNVLRARDGPGNEGHSVNTFRTIFFEAPEYRRGRPGLDERGEFLDPWGIPYQVVLDSNLNGICEVEHSLYGDQIGLGILVWSCGPDRLSDTPDDRLSWKR